MKNLLLNLVLTIVFFGVIPAGLIFVPAGRSDLWNVWVYVGIGVVLFIFQTLALYRKSPDLLKERMRSGAPGRVRWTVGRAWLALSILQLIIVGLDQRFHWSDIVSPVWVVAGLVSYAIGWGLFTWAALVNPFFSPEVRIQSDRGQQVINEGPYAIVRHPGYAGNLLAMVASVAALNSLLSIIPAVIFLAVTFRVTAIEDPMLQDELPGYVDYAAKVRYRLVPGVW
jgi:protein-S-isoprenylcysteine O-methyltransferase Ste14